MTETSDEPTDDPINDVIDELATLVLPPDKASVDHFAAVFAPAWRQILAEFLAARLEAVTTELAELKGQNAAQLGTVRNLLESLGAAEAETLRLRTAVQRLCDERIAVNTQLVLRRELVAVLGGTE